MKKLTKKNKKVLNKLLEKHICPHCKTDIPKGGDLGWAEQGECSWELSWNGSSIDYDEEHFEGNGQGKFFCRSCGSYLDLREDEAIEILKQQT